MRHVGAVVVAAGRGERLGGAGGDRPKALVELAGATIIEHAVQRLHAAGFEHLVIVHTPGHRDAFAAVLSRAAGQGLTLVPGGATRSQSVRAGVGALGDGIEVVAIHDAARALTPADVISRTVAAVTRDVIAAAPGRAVPDTLKRVTSSGDVHATVPRDHLWSVQTPQVVRRDVLEATLRWAEGRDATDDLGLVENAVAAGVVTGRIRLVPGDPRALKITEPGDLDLARDLLEGRT